VSLILMTYSKRPENKQMTIYKSKLCKFYFLRSPANLYISIGYIIIRF